MYIYIPHTCVHILESFTPKKLFKDFLVVKSKHSLYGNFILWLPHPLTVRSK